MGGVGVYLAFEAGAQLAKTWSRAAAAQCAVRHLCSQPGDSAHGDPAAKSSAGEASGRWAAWKPGLRKLERVPRLPYINAELADAFISDKRCARERLYDYVHSQLATQLGAPTARTVQLQLQHLEGYDRTDLWHLLKPCVPDTLLAGTDDDMRRRLLAVLHHTALQGQQDVDLECGESMAIMGELYTSAFERGIVRQPVIDDSVQRLPPRTHLRPVTVEQARKRMQENCGAVPERALVGAEDAAQVLDDAGMEDVAIIDLRLAPESSIDCDFLVLASGRSARHALAGVHAVRYLIKEARRAAGVRRDVPLACDGVTPWYSVTAGSLSAHCMSREIRAELELEKLWGDVGNLRWWRKGARALTIDSITAEGEDSCG